MSVSRDAPIIVSAIGLWLIILITRIIGIGKIQHKLTDNNVHYVFSRVDRRVWKSRRNELS